MYVTTLRHRTLEKGLRELGWKLQPHGGKHDVWTNADSSFAEYVPRHPEINDKLAQVILRRAQERR